MEPAGNDEWSDIDDRTGIVTGARSVLLQLLSNTRRLILLAVGGMFLSAITLLIYGVLLTLLIVWDTFMNRTIDIYGLEHLMVELVMVTDAMLLGSVLVLVGLGLFQLFIDTRLPLPPWLRIKTLDELKTKLLGVVAVLIAVSFVGLVVEYDGDEGVLEIALAISAVVIAISVFLAIGSRHGTDGH